MLLQGGPQTWLFLWVDNFATISDRKACNMSKVSKFRVEKVWNLDLSEIKYPVPSLDKYSIHLKICYIW